MDDDKETEDNHESEDKNPEDTQIPNEGNANTGNDDDSAITNATKNLLSSIRMVFCLFFDEKYNSDYHVSLEKVMQLKKFEHGDGAAVSCDFLKIR